MESSEISLHQVKLFSFLGKSAGEWHTSRSAAAGARLNERTVRAHLLKFVKLGIVDQTELFPGHRYRLSPLAEKRNKALVQRLKQAVEIFGGT